MRLCCRSAAHLHRHPSGLCADPAGKGAAARLCDPGPISRARLIRDLLARPRRYAYGRARSQRADLYLPRGSGPHPVAVLLHGGSWQARYGKLVMRGLAGDLRRRGWGVWNVEYRRIGRGQGGGWPATFEDVAAAIDLLAELDVPLDLARVAVIGHSAGGQLALWAAGRGSLAEGDPGARPRVTVSAAVSQAGVIDLAGSYRAGWMAVRALMGGGPDELPERYRVADPMGQIPLPIPVLLVHGLEDDVVTIARSRRYAQADREAGGTAQLVEVAGRAGRHRAHVDPRGRAWQTVTAWLAVLPFAPPR
jgi:acetyl esterase/lipase